MLDKKVVSTLPRLNPLLIQNPLRHLYQASEVCLRSYSAHFCLKTKSGIPWSSNQGG